ncbi:hypothetical protein [Pararhizobium sp. O133]|uniref:hypothetical protein n=1 Tax=Pararhizobium sp. O133 TaxID=3449278 RepID=UPI003F686273
MLKPISNFNDIKRLQNGPGKNADMLHGGYSGKHSPSTASPETGPCTLVGFDGLGKTRPYVYMLLTIILCRPLALPFYNLVIVKNLQTGSFSAIGTRRPTGFARIAMGCARDGKTGQDQA